MVIKNSVMPLDVKRLRRKSKMIFIKHIIQFLKTQDDNDEIHTGTNFYFYPITNRF